jgi:hypothetical protein
MLRRSLAVNRLTRMRKSSSDVSRLHGAIVAKRHQYEQRLLDRAHAACPKAKERRGIGMEHDEVGLAARLQRADAILKAKRPGAAEGGEIEPLNTGVSIWMLGRLARASSAIL